MHDTYNCANLIANKVRIIRDDAEKTMYGEEKGLLCNNTGMAGKTSYVEIIVVICTSTGLTACIRST